MDGPRFDALTRSLTAARSRRQALVTLLGGSWGLLGWQGIDHAAAHNPLKSCKKKSGKQKKACIKKAKAHNATHTTQGAPPPAGPVTTADAACHFPPGSGREGARVAQTFRALRSGQLTSASVLLMYNVAGASFDLEIWSVNAANAPSTVLAGTTIANVPATAIDELQPRTLAGTFRAPPTVVAGLRYAVVVTESPFQGAYFQMGSNGPCPDGNFFSDPAANGTFEAQQQLDLDFATFVTA